ncbi:MAG: S8 family serine peptidase [Phycisphaerales bacterium]|nr:S8 family serine peptidase [Phycisphaerales bacterium]
MMVRHGAVVRSSLRTVNGMVIELPLDNIAALAGEDAVQYIEPALPPFAEVNDSNRVITEADIVQAIPYGLDGTGVKVLVYDGGYARSTHVDFEGRLTVHDNSGLSTHATHVSATIGGSGAASGGQYHGMAPGVTIESYGFEQAGGLSQGFLYTDPGDLETDYDEAINTYHTVLANNSIGTNTAPNGFPCEWEGDYGVTASIIDSIVRGSLGEPMRIVWANGNERGSGRCGTTYHTTAPPACGKNHITVGALNSNDDSVSYFTSWGPTDDDRLKPDISAPGCQSNGDGGVTSASASSDTAYTTYCGTSMASPTVTGLSALLIEDYRLQYPERPDFLPSTLKAMLAHNAEDIEEPGPDYKTGYGSVRIQRTIDFMRTDSFLEGQATQGSVQTLLVVVAAGDSELKVTLAWDDPPGTPNVSPSLVNDLDIRVFAPNGTQHFPWTLGGIANPSAPAVQTQADHTNNIEQVYVASPQPGIWTVEIHGFDVPVGPQTYSACVSPQFTGDCNLNGVDDTQDVIGGTSFDCNANLIPDECEPDVDCNSNGTRDICDIGGGASFDVNANNIPDECEPDCNANNLPDSYEIDEGLIGDCNGNGTPDDCDVSAGTSADCDGDIVPDECESDCNGNGIVDGCDILSGSSTDCDGNSIPDECETDCNNNGVVDACDILEGTSADIDGNGFPDECDKLFVDSSATGGNDGSNWANAYTELTDALAFAETNPFIAEIWVAQGNYAPDQPGGDRAATFKMRSGLAMYGGFSGNESALAQRDPELYPTILTGDLNGDDGPNWAGMSENSYHVVTAANVGANAIIDGFTITRGWSWQSTGGNASGAGMRISSASPTVANCKFKENLSHLGAGMLCLDASPTISDCVFDTNEASDGRGGAIYCQSSLPHSVTIERCTFRNNRATVGAGPGDGGAIYSSFDTQVHITDSLFENNSAVWRFTAGSYAANGGAVLNQTDGSSISHTTFRGNRAHYGGAIWIGGDLIVDNCVFIDNEAFRQSAGAFDYGGVAGAIYAFLGQIDVRHSSFYENFSPTFGGIYATTSAVVDNTILWGNRSTEVGAPLRDANLAGTFDVTYSCVEGLLTPVPGEDPPNPGAYPTVTVNDPLWVNPDGPDGIAGTLDDNLRLSGLSPCVDTGDPLESGIAKLDFDAKPRVLCGRIDMGAYETSAAEYACAYVPGPTDFANWTYCMYGPSQSVPLLDCLAFDQDADADVDLADFTAFQSLFITGLPYLSPPATISGNIGFGSVPGTAIIAASDVTDPSLRYTTSRTSTGPYVISIPFAGGYDVTAFLDANGNGEFDPGEQAALYASNPVAVTSPAEAITGVDLSLGNTHAISGTVRWVGGSGMSGVDVTLSGAASDSTTTGGSGAFAFSNLPDGAYTVTPTRPAYYFYPFDANVALAGADETLPDFVGRPIPTGEVDGEESGTVTAVDLAGFNLTLDVGGSPLTLFVYADTVISGSASQWDDIQVGWSVTAQYYTSTNLAVELDGEP